MSFCTNCGAEQINGSLFCHKCGKSNTASTNSSSQNIFKDVKFTTFQTEATNNDTLQNQMSIFIGKK